ncbi:MAG: hypothetical protein QGM45_12210, partial [Anaerolineales bacterium]|nr:hypothetical protein [Anaerolineales bacterium]
MRVEIRDYRGVERADIDMSLIALVAGPNETGKSCVAEATRAALTGNPIPIAGVLKKDAKLLVRDGAEKGHACVTDGEYSTMVCWPTGPTATAVSKSVPIKCSGYAAGFTHILDLNAKDRAKVLATYIKSMPTKEDVVNAATDAGYTEGAIAKIWESIEDAGWDHTYKRAREYTVTLKGQWQEVAGEKYGAKKGESYRVADDEGRSFLTDCLATAERAVVDTAGAVAVSESEIENLKRKIDEAAGVQNQIAINDELNATRDDLSKVQQERAAMPEDPDKAAAEPEVIPCPECGAALMIEAGVIHAYEKPKPPEALSPKVIQRREALDVTIAEHHEIIGALEQRIKAATKLTGEAKAAKARLKTIEAAPKLDEAVVELAKDTVGDARAALTSFDFKVRAYKLHGDLVKNDKLIGILAPDGLRKRKLAGKLDAFNATLAALCESARWPAVRLDENLECRYDIRPIWGASKSGQWRARAIIQVAMAQLDG